METKYKWIFSLLLITNILINLDHGIIPAASLKIEESLHLNDVQLGYLGSLVYAGISCVGLFAGKLFLHYNSKIIIFISYLGMMASLVVFPQNYGVDWPFYVSRFLTGAAQAPMMVYFPVWVDNFGKDLKTIWLTALQGVIPLGIFVGYVLSSVISNIWGWHYCFYSQVVALMPCALCFLLLVKSHDFDIKKSTKIQIERRASVVEDVRSSIGVTHRSYCSLIQELLRIKTWVFVTLIISILYFVVTGISFWMPNYMKTVLKQPEQTVDIVFATVSITAPVLGCVTVYVLCGSITQYLGGYEKTKSLYVCLFYCIICCLSAAPCPFLDNFWIGSACVWSLLFFGGALVPPLLGIMLSSVPTKLKAFANSNCTTIQNLLGFLPAPTVYGYLTQFGDRAGITFLMFYPCAGLFFMFLTIYYKRKDLDLKKQLATSINDHDRLLNLSASAQREEEEENYTITERVLHYNDMPMSVSMAQHMDERAPQYYSEDTEQSDEN